MRRGRRVDPDSRPLATEEAFCWRVAVGYRGRALRPIVVAQDAAGALEVALVLAGDLAAADLFDSRPEPLGEPQQLHPVAMHHPAGMSAPARRRAARVAAARVRWVP